MIQIEAIPAFSDNYIWLLYDSDSGDAVVVDPGEAAPVQRALADRGLQLTAVLVTHHHPDHIGGINELAGDRDIPVLGPESIRQVTRPLRDGDHFQLLGAGFSVLAVPGHTLDHLALYSTDAAEQPLLFCGDTLFAGGCGRIFEGDPGMMLASLTRLAGLPENTLVYCAHEYTLSNLTFARAAEPDNRTLRQRFDDTEALRAEDIPTVPSTMGLELETNPFLRCHLPTLKTAAESHSGHACDDNLQVFATVRNWKDNF